MGDSGAIFPGSYRPAAPGRRRARGADADAGTDQGPKLKHLRNAPTGRAEVARKYCSRTTCQPIASRRPIRSTDLISMAFYWFYR
jgi:hypothetical protein